MLTANTEVGTAVDGDEAAARFTTPTSRSISTRSCCWSRRRSRPRSCAAKCATLRARQAQPYGPTASSARATPIKAVRALLHKIAVSPASTVLLTGESGTGKDLAAKVIHYSSNRAVEAVHEHHLLGAAGDAARKRAVRPRARRVHRRGSAEARPDRIGRRRHGVPRRDRRDGAAAAGQAAALPRGEVVQARRRLAATSRSTCASSRRPIARSRRRSRRATSARTCTTAST